jgi:hypothetical protein
MFICIGKKCGRVVSQWADHGEAGTKRHRRRVLRDSYVLLESVFGKCEFRFREFGCLKLESLSWYICLRQILRIATGLQALHAFAGPRRCSYPLFELRLADLRLRMDMCMCLFCGVVFNVL